MIIGLTYDLRQSYLDMGYSESETAEFDSVETVEALEHALKALGHDTARVGNGRELTEKLVNGERWDLVFNIAEGLKGIGREAQVPAILDLYDIPYTFSDPMVMSLTLHKAMTKRVIRDAGLATADFKVVSAPEDAYKIQFDPPFFVKPLAEGTGKGVTAGSVIEADRIGESQYAASSSHPLLAQRCKELLEQFNQPVLVERFLPGREFTVGITGSGNDAEVLGTMEIILLEQAEKGGYSFVNKEGWKERVTYRPLRSEDGETLLLEVEKLALESWKVLECRDGGRVDIRCDEYGTPCFIEVNPLAGLRPEYSDLPILSAFFGISYLELIRKIVESACKRTSPSSQNSYNGHARMGTTK